MYNKVLSDHQIVAKIYLLTCTELECIFFLCEGKRINK